MKARQLHGSVLPALSAAMLTGEALRAQKEVSTQSPRRLAAQRLRRNWTEWHRREDQAARQSPFYWYPLSLTVSVVIGLVIAGVTRVMRGDLPEPVQAAAIVGTIGYVGVMLGRPLWKQLRRSRARRVEYERPDRLGRAAPLNKA